MSCANRAGVALFIAALMFSTTSNLEAADASMTPEERAHVVKLLKDSEVEYLAAIQNVSDEQWKWKPAPDRWSVGETAEHILLAETALFTAVQRAIQSPRIRTGRPRQQAKLNSSKRQCPIAAIKQPRRNSFTPRDYRRRRSFAALRKFGRRRSSSRRPRRFR